MYTASSARYASMPYHRCGQSGLLLAEMALDNTAFTPDELRAIDAASGY